MTKPEGASLVGFGSGAPGGAAFRAFDPTKNAEIEPSFISASADDVERAVQLAAGATRTWARLPGAKRHEFLRCIAAKLEANVPSLVERATRETGLPAKRCETEIARTAGQLRLYGEAGAKGDWLDARIETGNPARTPLPKPDHRSMMRPLGPVVVFGSSNFPFAYSVAGGDTASAFAAGCPVIVKAHPAHPGTGELVGRLIVEAVRECGLPEGSFSLLFDAGFDVGQALVKHPAVKAVGFTGSLRGGRALADLAAARPEPIPVYAEMGSVNPVFILPGALDERGAEIVVGLHQSSTLGVGQFCTNPGLIVMQRSAAALEFAKSLGERLASTPESPMLTAGIRKSFSANTSRRGQLPGVKQIAKAPSALPCGAAPVWFETDAVTFMREPALSEEIFGPSSVVVWCESESQMMETAKHLEGSLTASLHLGANDRGSVDGLVGVLEGKAGRVILNGYPTGLEVSHAIAHSGPYPATSDGGRSTSVGTRALNRWARLVCYQNFLDDLLPPELQNANPLGIRRLVDGEWTSGAT